MRKLLAIITFLFLSTTSWAAPEQLIAECGAIKGYAYYPFASELAIPKKNTGWKSDSISKGKFRIIIRPDDRLDLLYFDWSHTKKWQSSRAEGSKVILHRLAPNEITIFVYHSPVKSFEVFSIYHENDGSNLLVRILSRGVDSQLPSGSLMVGSCQKVGIF